MSDDPMLWTLGALALAFGVLMCCICFAIMLEAWCPSLGVRVERVVHNTGIKIHRAVKRARRR